MTIKLSFILTLLVVILVKQCQAAARAPIPYCLSKPIYKEFPLTFEEACDYDLEQIFSGYNLNISLAKGNNVASVGRKFQIIDRMNQSFPTIISHFVEKSGNTVNRDSFLLYKDHSNVTFLTYGVITDKGKLPKINSTVKITSEKDVECFDAALFLEHGLAVVDCAKKGERTFSTYTNYWYIADLTDHSIKKKIKNDLFIGFNQIKRRKLMKYSHPQDRGFTYLVRSYFSDGVDAQNGDNTYIQVFLVPVEDPTEIQLLRVIDRTFLNLNSLRIMDFEIYLQDIFLLDYDTGLFRLDILQSQRIVITGRYRDFGFEKFGVYSDDYEDECIIALANKHTVYEIDWHKTSQPTLLYKYSLMQNSKVKQVMLNDEYLFVQSSATVESSNTEYDYTWVFSKGSRTYLNAYHIIDHKNPNVVIDFDRENSHLYIADSDGLRLRQIDKARLVLQYLDSSLIGKESEVVIQAQSYDSHSTQSFKCQQTFTVYMIDKNNMTIFPTKYVTTNLYSVNFPKPLQIPLGDYVVGPNIEYSLKNMKGQVPTYWINKLNRTSITIDHPTPPGDIVFFHTDVIPELGQEIVIYYYQDAQYKTHVTICAHYWEKSSMQCQLQKTYNHTSYISAFSSTFFRDQQGWNYYYIIAFEGQNKIFHIYDFVRQHIIAQITYQGSYDAEITSIAASNQFLFVVRKYAKTIDVFSLAKCAEFSTCVPDFSITPGTLKKFGINYFSPIQVVTDIEHPQVMFIKCLGSVLILDVDNKERIHLLDEIVSPPTAVNGFRISVSKTSMAIVASPDLVYEYSLEHLYRYNMVVLRKVLNLHGRKIQPQADIQYSDFDGTLYINAYDQKLNVSVILVYRTGLPASWVPYTQIVLDKLYSRPGFEVQVSGFFVNFLSIATRNNFTVYRVFPQPFLSIQQNHDDFSFQIQAHNSASKVTTQPINVTVVNTNEQIIPTKDFNFTNVTYSKHGSYDIDDKHWFDGNVIHYNYSCDECHLHQKSKVRLREHFDNFKDMDLSGNFYTQSLFGGVSIWEDLFRFRPNGSVYQVSLLPDQKVLQRCNRVAVSELQIFTVTACQEIGRGINLYVTSFTSFKAFTWGPYHSAAYQARNLQIINDIVMLADTPSNPEYKFKEGAIYLYKASFNPESGDEMDELDIIDSNDFLGCSGWTQQKAYLGNAYMLYSDNTDAYRLYITEINNGIFVVDFKKAHIQDPQITILTTTYIDINKLLAANNLHMPNDAIFLSTTFVKSIPSPHFDTENILVTTRGYHNFEITVVYDDKGIVQSTILHRVYHRYIYYNAVNEVQADGGFILMGYTLPPDVDILNKTKQYIVIYDSIDYPHQFDKGYSERYMTAGIHLDHTTAANFAINTTYDFETKGKRMGVVIGLATGQYPRLIQASIAHNLTLEISQGFANQTLQIVAYNDFNKFTFEAILDDTEPSPKPQPEQDSEVLIIIIIIACGVVTIFFIFYLISLCRKKQQPEERESLLTENQIIRQSQSDSRENPVVPVRSQVVEEAPRRLVRQQDPQPEHQSEGSESSQNEQSEEEQGQQQPQLEPVQPENKQKVDQEVKKEQIPPLPQEPKPEVQKEKEEKEEQKPVQAPKAEQKQEDKNKEDNKEEKEQVPQRQQSIEQTQ